VFLQLFFKKTFGPNFNMLVFERKFFEFRFELGSSNLKLFNFGFGTFFQIQEYLGLLQKLGSILCRH